MSTLCPWKISRVLAPWTHFQSHLRRHLLFCPDSHLARGEKKLLAVSPQRVWASSSWIIADGSEFATNSPFSYRGTMLCVQKHRAGNIWSPANIDTRTIVRRAFVVILFTVVSLMEERRTGLTEQIPRNASHRHFLPSVFRTSSVAVWVDSLLWGLDRTEPYFRPHAYLWGAYRF